MTTTDPKTEPARRTYASLRDERGFSTEAALSLDRFTVSVQPMDIRTYWRHVGGGVPTRQGRALRGGGGVKVLPRDKWNEYGQRIAWMRKEAFCSTFGHGKTEQRGLRNPVSICARCRHGVKP